MKRQADKTSLPQVELHIKRQQVLGERAIGDHDKPRRWELIVTLVAVVLIGVGSMRGWW